MNHRPLASPLHAARAGAAASYCSALAAAGLLFESPLVIAAVAAAALLAAAGAGVAGPVARTARWALPLALVVAVVNGLVVRDGLTVVLRLGEAGPLGRLDVTLEALTEGAVLGARVVAIGLVFALFGACVDPDGLLRLLRRVGFRGALTAVLATRLVPVLARDARRMAEGRRCRADGGGTGPGARVAVLRAVTTSALDRAVDVAATLELRGYARAPRRAARVREPWSRHDAAFSAAAAAIAALAAGARAADVASFDAYPTLRLATGPATLGLCAALVTVAGLPFLDRRGVER